MNTKESFFYGPAYWRCIHYFALHTIPYSSLLEKIPEFLPEEYKAEWEAPFEDESLIDWSIRLHNKVNAKLGKWSQWNQTDFAIAHKAECDFKTDQQYVFFFPWGFLHMIAEFESPSALAFLQTFNEVYPDVDCRGKFFTDAPAADETLVNYVTRHQKRMNLAFGFPEEYYIPVRPSHFQSTKI